MKPRHGRRQAGTREERHDGVGAGFIGKMIVGSVAAVVILAVNPPGDSWLVLTGTALAAGIGGDAIVLGFVATGRIDAAVTRSEEIVQAAMSQLDSIAEAVGMAVAATPASNMPAMPSDPVRLVVTTQVSTAKATLKTFLRK